MRKIINISSFSRSRVNQDPIAGSFYGWHSQYGREVHQRLDIAVECWSIDAGIPKPTSYERDGILYRIFPAKFFLAPGREISFELLRALRREIAEHDVIVHLHDYHNWQSYAIALFVRRAKIVAHYHGATKRPLERFTSVRRTVFAPIFLSEFIVESLAVRRIKKFLLANTQDHEYYERHKLNFAFCPMAPDLQFFKQIDRNRARDELQLAPNDCVLLDVGGFARPKNLGLFVAAVDRLRQTLPVRAFIIGPTYQGGYRQSIEAMIQRFRLEPHIKIVDFLPKNVLNVYYNAADALIVTSNIDEGGPTAALEALALGIPVVSTRVGFAEDIIQKTHSLLHLVNSSPMSVADEVKKLIANRHQREPTHVWTWDDVMTVVRPTYEALFQS